MIRARAGVVFSAVRIDSGAQTIGDGDHAAVIAAYSRDGAMSRSLVSTATALVERGYECVVSQTVDAAVAAPPPPELPPSVVVIRRPNIGYDFGSWASALAHFDIAPRPYVLLVNDSMLGPLASLDPVIDHFEGTYADAWAAVSNTQFFRHVQSFFMGFRGGVLADRELRRWWRGIEHEVDKHRIIDRYEIGLNRVLFAEAYSRSAFLEARQFAVVPTNAMMDHWRDVVDAGFPFVKRELVTRRELGVAADVESFLRDRYGTTPTDWM